MTVNVQYNFLPVTGFELWTSGIGNDHSANWATFTAKINPLWQLILAWTLLQSVEVNEIAVGNFTRAITQPFKVEKILYLVYCHFWALITNSVESLLLILDGKTYPIDGIRTQGYSNVNCLWSPTRPFSIFQFTKLLFLKWANPGLFFFIFVFSIQLTENIQYKFLPMTGFKPWTSGVRSNRSTNWATTTAPFTKLL